MSNSSPKPAPAFEPEERTKAKKGSGQKGSEAPLIRAFVAAAYKGRLANPGYIKACHSKAPEAMVKVVPNPPHGSQVLRLFEYVARKDADEKILETEPGLEGIEQKPALMLENQDGLEIQGEAEIKELYKEWAADFESKTKDKNPRHVMHLVLSAKAKATPETRQKVLDAARRVAKKRFPNQKFVLGLHQDGGKPHVHLVVACNGIEKGSPKLRVGPSEIMQLRTDFARELTFEGLKHVATLRKDRPHIQEKVRNGEERLKPERRYWFTGAHKEMTEGFKELDALHKAFQEREASGLDPAGMEKIKQQIQGKAGVLEILVQKKLKEGSKNRAAAYSAMRKVKRDVGLEARNRARNNSKQSEETRSDLIQQRAAILNKMAYRQARDLPVDWEKEDLKRINERIAHTGAEQTPKAKLEAKLAAVQKEIDSNLSKGVFDRAQVEKMTNIVEEINNLAEKEFKKKQTKARPASLAKQKADLETKINERQAKGLSVVWEKADLERISSRIAANEAAKATSGMNTWDLAQIQKSIEAGEAALKASDMTPEARAQAQAVLNYHKATVAKATAPTLPLAPTLAPETRTIAPQVAPLAPRLSVEPPRPASAPQKAPETPKMKPALSKGFRR